MKKILLLGDSIRQGYDSYVKIAFEDSAKVYYPAENCMFSSYILRMLNDWKNFLDTGDDVDVIHWNAGLWDDLVLADGKNHTSIEYYKDNIERICVMIGELFPNAKNIFATSTPVIEDGFGGFHFRRYNSDTERYNEAAVKIVTDHGGYINDLYTLLKNSPTEYHSDQTHYYSREGTEIICNKVISAIEACGGITAKVLDYEKLFYEAQKVKGI